MSYIYLQDSGEACSAACYLDIAPSARWRSARIDEEYSYLDSETVSSRASLSGTTSEPSTPGPGKESASSRGAFHAREQASRGEGEGSTTQEPACGLKCEESSTSVDLGTYSARTAPLFSVADGAGSSEIWPRWGTAYDGGVYPLETLGRPTSARDSSFLPTPTRSNGRNGFGLSRSGRRRYSRRTTETVLMLIDDLGWRAHPMATEWVMGLPLGWSEPRPLEMPRFLRWLHRHSLCSWPPAKNT